MSTVQSLPLTQMMDKQQKCRQTTQLRSGHQPPATQCPINTTKSDAAAGMDDWVFQGLDTAFFDNLMHEVGDSFSHFELAAGTDSGFPI
jgi:hypothetical protein